MVIVVAVVLVMRNDGRARVGGADLRAGSSEGRERHEHGGGCE